MGKEGGAELPLKQLQMHKRTFTVPGSQKIVKLSSKQERLWYGKGNYYRTPAKFVAAEQTSKPAAQGSLGK